MDINLIKDDKKKNHNVDCNPLKVLCIANIRAVLEHKTAQCELVMVSDHGLNHLGRNCYALDTLHSSRSDEGEQDSLQCDAAPNIFQRVMSTALMGMKEVAYLIDGIAIARRTLHEHNQRLRNVLLKLQDIGLLLNLNKCVFAADSIT